jgi:hypothetical protein
VYRKKNNNNTWLLGWFKYVYVMHWMPFGLLAATWLSGYIIHANLNSPVLVLYYAAHIFAAAALLAVGMFYLHPGNKDIESSLQASDPGDVTKAVHRVFFHILRIMPIMGALVFFVPDSGYELGKDGSFWLNHVYNDNFAHLAHAMLFYLFILLGAFNFLYVLNKRLQTRAGKPQPPVGRAKSAGK